MKRLLLFIVFLTAFSPAGFADPITEDWNCADSDSLTCDLTWTEFGTGDLDIVSQEVQAQAVGSATAYGAYNSSNLASVDHYAQVVITAQGNESNTTASAPGVGCRKASGATETYYYFRANDRTTDSYQLFKISGGGSTQLGSDVNETIATPPYTIRIECQGETIRGLIDGVEKISVTNGDISTGTLTVIRNVQNNGATSITFDDFEADVFSTGTDVDAVTFDAGTKSVHFPTGTKSVTVQ